MESEHVARADAPTSRRDLRRRSADRPARSSRTSSPVLPPAARRWAPRAALLTALATATIAVPVAGSLSAEAEVPGAAPLAAVAYPTAQEVLAAPEQQVTPTSLLQAVRGAAVVSETVSRAIERNPLPGCEGSADPASANGQIDADDLCALWDGTQLLRGDAAVALAELNLNYRAEFGRDLCITDSYRSLGAQRQLAYRKPGLAATPGTSNHGWGLAIDLCPSETNNGGVMRWLEENGRTYGWANPGWAQRGGSGAYEPWHWEYVPGTRAMGTDYES